MDTVTVCTDHPCVDHGNHVFCGWRHWYSWKACDRADCTAKEGLGAPAPSPGEPVDSGPANVYSGVVR